MQDDPKDRDLDPEAEERTARHFLGAESSQAFRDIGRSFEDDSKCIFGLFNLSPGNQVVPLVEPFSLGVLFKSATDFTT